MKQLKLTIAGKVKTFDLPENGEYKCEVTESYVPKIGDCVRVECSKTDFFLFKVKKVLNKRIDFELAIKEDLNIFKNGVFVIINSRIFTQITPEELKAKYAEAGYDWDYESDTIKPIKWMPKDGDEVWFLNIYMKPVSLIFNKKFDCDKKLLEKGLLFKTEEECQKFADHCLSYFNNK